MKDRVAKLDAPSRSLKRASRFSRRRPTHRRLWLSRVGRGRWHLKNSCCLHDCPCIADFLQPSDQHFFGDVGKRLRRSAERAVNCFSFLCPGLHETSAYRLLVSILLAAGYLCFVKAARSSICVFFVTKKDGRIRFIIDARPTNRICIRPAPSLACFCFVVLGREVPETLRDFCTAGTGVSSIVFIG